MFDEFTGQTLAGAWTVALIATNSTDAESSIVHYVWNLGTDTFDGTRVSTEKWITAGNVTQSNELTIASERYAWGTDGIVSRDAYARGYGMALQARVNKSSGGLGGCKRGRR